MRSRSRFESDTEYQNRLLEEIERLRCEATRRAEEAYAESQRRYEDDEHELSRNPEQYADWQQ